MIQLREETPPFPFLTSPLNTSLSSSSIDTPPLKKLTIPKANQPNKVSYADVIFYYYERIASKTECFNGEFIPEKLQPT
jgi:hypothetical protein